MTQDKLLTSKDVIERLSISRATLSNLVRRHGISHVKIGGRYYFTEQHISDFVKSRTRLAR